MSHPIERFQHREQTYISHEAARRAFYRYVAKHDLYGNLYIAYYFKGKPVYARKREKCNYGGIGFANGIPTFRSWRNEAYRSWNIDFVRARERLVEEENRRTQKEPNERWEAAKRLDTVRSKRTSHFFQITQAAAELAHDVEARKH